MVANALKKIMKHDPQSKVIMITGVESTEIANDCLSIGAKGYINKKTIDASSEESRVSTLSEIQKLLEGIMKFTKEELNKRLIKSCKLFTSQVVQNIKQYLGI